MREVITKLMSFGSQNTYYQWKKQNRPIIGLLDKYFTKEDLEEFLETGKITELEEFKKFKEIKESKEYKQFKEFQSFKEFQELQNQSLKTSPSILKEQFNSLTNDDERFEFIKKHINDKEKWSDEMKTFYVEPDVVADASLVESERNRISEKSL